MADEQEQIVEETVEPIAPAPLTEEELGASYDEIQARDEEPEEEEQPRDEHGRFASKEETEETEEAAPAEAAAEEIQTDGVIASEAAEGEPVEPVIQPPPTAAPPSWSEGAKSHWASLAPEVQHALLDQEAERSRVDQQKDQWFREVEPIVRALEPAAQQMQLAGATPAQFVQQLIAADQFLRRDPNGALRWIAQQYGASMPDPYETGYDDVLPSQPDMSPVLTEVDQLKQQITQMQQEQAQAQTRQFETEIETFGAQHPHFEKVRHKMGDLIRAGLAEDLQSAYDQAVWLEPTVRAEMGKPAEVVPIQQEEKSVVAKKAATAKRRIAETNLSSAGTAGGNPVPPMSDEEELGQVFDRMTGN